MRRSCSVLAGAVSVGVLLGCNGTATHPRAVPTPPPPSTEAGKPADTVISDAHQALLAASSVRVTGTFSLSGGSRVATPSTQRIDLRLTTVGGNPAATGRVTTVTGSGAKAATVTLEVVRLGGTFYVRGDRGWYARIGPKAVAVTGRWLALPVSQDKSLADLTDLSAVASGIAPTSSDRVRGTARLGSADVVVVTAGAGATLYVVNGPDAAAARPVRLQRSVTAAAGVNGVLEFSDYDAAVPVAAPAGAIPIAQVSGSGAAGSSRG